MEKKAAMFKQCFSLPLTYAVLNMYNHILSKFSLFTANTQIQLLSKYRRNALQLTSQHSI